MFRIPLIKPYITDEVKQKVLQVLDSGQLTEGVVTGELESLFCDYIGCKYSIAVTSCTTGLEIALRAIGIGNGDEVIVPDYTYPATADVVSIVGAKIVLVDVDPETMLIDYDRMEKAITPKTKAIIPVSLFGNPLDYNRLKKIKEKTNIFIIEDAACSLGAEYKEIKIGNLADISVFSLHPRKFVTTGEGGIITTNNSAWADWISSYKHFGMTNNVARSEIHFERIGTNYKLSNILAAVGVAQMKHIDILLEKRRSLAKNYKKMFSDFQSVKIPQTTCAGDHSYQSFCVMIEDRDEVMRKMRADGIEVQIGTYSLHMHKAFNNNSNCRINDNMTGSKHAYDHCITLPMYHEMTEHEQQSVVEMLAKVVKK